MCVKKIIIKIAIFLLICSQAFAQANKESTPALSESVRIGYLDLIEDLSDDIDSFNETIALLKRRENIALSERKIARKNLDTSTGKYTQLLKLKNNGTITDAQTIELNRVDALLPKLVLESEAAVTFHEDTKSSRREITKFRNNSIADRDEIRKKLIDDCQDCFAADDFMVFNTLKAYTESSYMPSPELNDDDWVNKALRAVGFIPSVNTERGIEKSSPRMYWFRDSTHRYHNGR